MSAPTPSAETLIQRLPRHLKMGELRVFAAVLEHRSFRKAAAVLHLTQPAVTKAVAALEQTLGVKLFDRVPHGVELTVHGRSFAPRVSAIFDELRRAAQELVQVNSGAAGRVRVGVVPMPAIPLLPLALNGLLLQHPGVQVSVVEERETELAERLRKRDIEVAVLRLSLIDPGEDMVVHALYDERLCVVARAGHPLAARRTLSWSELLEQRWVLPPADCFFYDHVLRTLHQLDLPMPRQVVEAISIHVQFGLVLHAGLLGFGMRSQASFAPGKDFLVRLPYELPVLGTPVAAVTLKSHASSPLAMALISQLQALAAPQSSPQPVQAVA
ncbi:MAG TPA: LysR family transcriptional regulator [Rubrivivax sp.]|mgnify:CR=1 FL=1|nr:LysR family transcriptional regulator [Rubrivivax sp.]